ncbi:hypothetical protein [Ralstonia phage vB_RsoP_BMB50]|uniref:Uncharacterized protein n=1 Tax=Ralstonia phage vB_RsoP_BMB50 TaxID=2834269 RepID=A0A8E5NVX9_9CAUD|nr:hypothetical protein [Ralstonia phage vB_RsoP_BMB50]
MIAKPRTVTWTPHPGYMLCTVEQDEFSVSLALSELSASLYRNGTEAAMKELEAQCEALLDRQIKDAHDRP